MCVYAGNSYVHMHEWIEHKGSSFAHMYTGLFQLLPLYVFFIFTCTHTIYRCIHTIYSRMCSSSHMHIHTLIHIHQPQDEEGSTVHCQHGHEMRRAFLSGFRCTGGCNCGQIPAEEVYTCTNQGCSGQALCGNCADARRRPRVRVSCLCLMCMCVCACQAFGCVLLLYSPAVLFMYMGLCLAFLFCYVLTGKCIHLLILGADLCATLLCPYTYICTTHPDAIFPYNSCVFVSCHNPCRGNHYIILNAKLVAHKTWMSDRCCWLWPHNLQVMDGNAAERGMAAGTHS